MNEEPLEMILRDSNFGAFTPDNNRGTKIATKAYVLTILEIGGSVTKPQLLRKKKFSVQDDSQDVNEDSSALREWNGIVNSPTSMDKILLKMVKRGYIEKEVSRPVSYEINPLGKKLLEIYQKVARYRKRRNMYKAFTVVNSIDFFDELIKKADNLSISREDVPDDFKEEVLNAYREEDKDTEVLDRFEETLAGEMKLFIELYMEKQSHKETESNYQDNFLSYKEKLDNHLYDKDELSEFHSKESDEIEWLIEEDVPTKDFELSPLRYGTLKIKPEKFTKLITTDNEETKKILEDIKQRLHDMEGNRIEDKLGLL